jgi:hypothetical protein
MAILERGKVTKPRQRLTKVSVADGKEQGDDLGDGSRPEIGDVAVKAESIRSPPKTKDGWDLLVHRNGTAGAPVQGIRRDVP